MGVELKAELKIKEQELAAATELISELRAKVKELNAQVLFESEPAEAPMITAVDLETMARTLKIIGEAHAYSDDVATAQNALARRISMIVGG